MNGSEGNRLRNNMPDYVAINFDRKYSAPFDPSIIGELSASLWMEDRPIQLNAPAFAISYLLAGKNACLRLDCIA